MTDTDLVRFIKGRDGALLFARRQLFGPCLLLDTEFDDQQDYVDRLSEDIAIHGHSNCESGFHGVSSSIADTARGSETDECTYQSKRHSPRSFVKAKKRSFRLDTLAARQQTEYELVERQREAVRQEMASADWIDEGEYFYIVSGPATRPERFQCFEIRRYDSTYVCYTDKGEKFMEPLANCKKTPAATGSQRDTLNMVSNDRSHDD